MEGMCEAAADSERVLCGVRNCRGGGMGGRRMRWAPQKWYNMQYIDMSGKLFLCRRTENAKVRCSAAYPTGRERIAKGPSLPWGLTPLYLGYCHLNVLEGSVK